MNDKYSIDEVSKCLNIPKSTLRYYDSIDLCKPGMRDDKTNYRYYDYNQILLLEMIDRLKKLHLSLDQIKAHSHIKNVSFLEKLLLERREMIQTELDELLDIKKQNDALIKKIEQSKTIHSQPIIEIRQIPERYLYRLNLNFSIDDLYACIKILYSSYIKAINDIPAYEKGEVSLEISKDNLLKKRFSTYNAIGFFIQNNSALKSEHLSELAAGSYAVACHKGSYKSLNRTYKKLCKYLDDNGLTPTGSSIETSLINISMTGNPDEFITEIQVPVM